MIPRQTWIFEIWQVLVSMAKNSDFGNFVTNTKLKGWNTCATSKYPFNSKQICTDAIDDTIMATKKPPMTNVYNFHNRSEFLFASTKYWNESSSLTKLKTICMLVYQRYHQRSLAHTLFVDWRQILINWWYLMTHDKHYNNRIDRWHSPTQCE